MNLSNKNIHTMRKKTAKLVGMLNLAGAQKFSKDGYEQHMQVNHLAPALLSLILLPSLIRASQSRIINVNSVVMFNNVLFKKLPLKTGISVVCLSPGFVHTNVTRDLPRMIQDLYSAIPYFIFSPQEGCRSSLFAATDPQIPDHYQNLKTNHKSVCTLFISQNCKPTYCSQEAHNVETANRVWETTLELIVLPLDALEMLVDGEEVQCRYGKSLIKSKCFEKSLI